MPRNWRDDFLLPAKLPQSKQRPIVGRPPFWPDGNRDIGYRKIGKFSGKVRNELFAYELNRFKTNERHNSSPRPQRPSSRQNGSKQGPPLGYDSFLERRALAYLTYYKFTSAQFVKSCQRCSTIEVVSTSVRVFKRDADDIARGSLNEPFPKYLEIGYRLRWIGRLSQAIRALRA